MKTQNKWSELFVQPLVLFEGKLEYNMTALQFLLEFSLTDFLQNRAKTNVGMGLARKTSSKGKVCFCQNIECGL